MVLRYFDYILTGMTPYFFKFAKPKQLYFRLKGADT